LRPWLTNPLARKLGQNIKYDAHVLANAGIEVQGYVHDTMLESYVLEAHKPHGLGNLGERHLGRKGLNYEDVCGKGANQIPFAQVEVNRAAEYSCEDSEMTLHVHQSLWPRIEAEAGLRRVYEDIEIPVQVNGKLRSKIVVAPGTPEEQIKQKALADEKVQGFTAGKQIVKVIFTGKLVSIVVR